ncbi:hypothetical protein EVAR_103815_1 [Eumeta japonica]|uniref:Uncharacterized protein n=1 Tax=Eumeta variegata TaxID=151549 RepID=A0A4C1SQ36_EUMVA|nr:hypothetical protein EVAR_103815_1 [Eumeta japonica]
MQYCCRKTVTVPDAPSGKRSVGEDQRTTVNYHASATQHNTHQRLDAGEALEIWHPPRIVRGKSVTKGAISFSSKSQKSLILAVPMKADMAATKSSQDKKEIDAIDGSPRGQTWYR